MSVIPKHEPVKRKTKPEQEPQQPPKTKQRLEGPAGYGAYYWCVKTDLSESGEIYVYADAVRCEPTGGVLFVSRQDDGECINLALAAGKWTAVFAASVLDGHAVAVEHWEGEVVR